MSPLKLLMSYRYKGRSFVMFFLVFLWSWSWHVSKYEQETALPQQSNERAEKAFNRSSNCLPFTLLTRRQMYSLAHASVVANGNHRNVIHINVLLHEYLYLNIAGLAGWSLWETLLEEGWTSFFFPDHDRIVITDHDQREKIAVERTTLSKSVSVYLSLVL